MAVRVAIYRSYRLWLSPVGAAEGTPRDDYVETDEYAYEPIEPQMTVSEDRILDFWHGSGAIPDLIAELPEGYKWSGALGGVYHRETGEELPADRLAVLAGAVAEGRRRSVRGRPQVRTGR